MGRIIVWTEVTNPFDGDKSIRCGLLVDTGAGALILPSAWKERFGNFRHSEPVELQLANQEVVRGEACGPARIRMEGFRPIFNEAIFPDSTDGNPEPLLGYVILEQAQVEHFTASAAREHKQQAMSVCWRLHGQGATVIAP